MKPLQARAGIVVYFLGCTDTKPNRYVVKIRDFPNRIYSSHSAPSNMPYADKPQFFAEKRMVELGLTWQLAGLTYIESIGYVFTLGV